MTEAELQGLVIDMAQARGWMVRPSSQGSQTRNSRVRASQVATAGGFPDLVLARDGEVLFLELKKQDGKLSLEQVAWSMALPSNSGPIHYEVIRPSDLSRGRVEELLA